MEGISKNLKICFLYNKWVEELNRDHTSFFIELIETLKKTHNVEVLPEFEDAHKGLDYELTVDPGKFIRVHDCELIIEDLDSQVFYILSAHDQISQGVLSQQSNPKLKKVLYSQFIPNEIFHHTRKFYSKYEPWIYFRYSPTDLEPYYYKRKLIEKKIPRLFFQGKTDDRPIVSHISKDILSEQRTTNLDSYLENIIQYKLGFAVGGVSNGDLCYRDIEYMQLGIPFIKFEYISCLKTPLIPNYHYISIPVPEDLPIHNSVKKDRLGLEHHAKLVENRFKEVIGDEYLLNAVGSNARKYFEDFLTPSRRVEITLMQLNYFRNE